jgi:hypothetical protein
MQKPTQMRERNIVRREKFCAKKREREREVKLNVPHIVGVVKLASIS